MTKKTKKISILILSLFAIGIYILPSSFVTKADTDPKTVALLPNAPEVYHLRLTAYTSAVEETDDTPFITADGTYVHDGVVATNLLPFGTKVKIPSLFGDKVFTVNDRMARRYQKSLDIWMTTKTKAFNFGLRHADVIVLPQAPSVALTK